MKGFTTLLIGALAAQVYSFPSHVLEEVNLDADTLAKYEAIKRNPSQAEVLLHKYQARKTSLEERDEDVDIDAPILTPKAHKLHFEKWGLVGGILSPLSGPLSHLDIPTPQPQGLRAIPGDDPDHQYIPPGKTDIRGTCPTLNTLANHGYLSRDGITTFAEAANAIQTAYSMGFGLAVFLSALGCWQVAIFPPTLGVPVYGLDRHGLFELDGSISRGDRYYGDNHLLNMTRWNMLVEDANKYGNGLFNDATVMNNAALRVEESRAENPNFTLGANFAVVYATRGLLTRPLPNGTAPDVQDFKNIAPFYLNETFPDNWFRIPKPVSLVDLASDIGRYFLFRPQPLGSTYQGKFIPLEVTIPDESAAIGCLGLSLLVSGAPNEAEEVVQAANALVSQVFTKVLGDAGCDISDYAKPGGKVKGKSPDEYTNGGSGSGVTHPGEYDDQSVKSTGKSAGQAI